jgi:hypothetical protein
MAVAQDTVIRVNPGIWWVDSDLIFEGNGAHDNFALVGDGPCSRIALRNNARIILRNLDRWSVSGIQIVKASGGPPIDHMLLLDNCTIGHMSNVMLDGFGLGCGILAVHCGGCQFSNLKFWDMAATSASVRGIGMQFDQRTGNLDNKIHNVIMHPSPSGIGDSMFCVLGNTAGFFVTNLDSNPPAGAWTIDIDGAGGIHRESQIVNVGTALASGSRGAIRVVGAENINLTNVIIEGNGAVIADHLVHLDCWAGKCMGWSFNNIRTLPGFDFFHSYAANTVQFIGNTATRCMVGKEFIFQTGLDEVGNRIL